MLLQGLRLLVYIYPLDRKVVLGPISDITALSEETGLLLIPMNIYVQLSGALLPEEMLLRI